MYESEYINKWFIALLLPIFFLFFLVHVYVIRFIQNNSTTSEVFIQSIDTMKYSRDLAREKLHDPHFPETITTQVRSIAQTGATHIAIGTPYDEEFLPILTLWVTTARKYNLNVWFRGNFSGWEQWFGYKAITKEEHVKNVSRFIINNKELFRDGDLFSPCPECENGVIGDPRKTHDVEGFRSFIAKEYDACTDSFQRIHTSVACGLFSMNGDVAKLIMDKKTTASVGGIVVIDHYVKTPEQLIKDISDISKSSGGRVFLGEFGAPIPDIHGSMNEDEQAQWLASAFSALLSMPELAGVNYWTNSGGSTALWNDDGSAKKAVNTLWDAYTINTTRMVVTDVYGKPLRQAQLQLGTKITVTDSAGQGKIATRSPNLILSVSKQSFRTRSVETVAGENYLNVILLPQHPSLFERLLFIVQSIRDSSFHPIKASS